MGDDVGAGVGRTPLDGTHWRLRGFLGEEWRWAHLDRVPSPASSPWLSARVPGSVLDDLARAGEVPDLTRDLNSRLVEWVGLRTWAYVRGLTVPAARDGERLSLELEGIDPGGRILFDGSEIGHHGSTFVPCSIDITSRARGDHTLAVVVDPVPPGEPQVGDTARVRHHRTRMNEGWDFCPRVPHQGLWRSAAIRRTGPVRIEGAWVRPEGSSDDRVQLRFTTDAAVAVACRVDIAVTIDGTSVISAAEELPLRSGRTDHVIPFSVPDPQRWWPNGYGAQPIYGARIDLRVGGATSDTARVPFGIRTLELIPNDTPDLTARPYRFVVNGVPMYLNGWNWVPIDALHGLPLADRLDHLLDLAQRAHVNLLRVWGGGLIESDAFYAGCDRRGILVWQEFIQSSSSLRNAPSDDPRYVDQMRHEALAIVPLRRAHPSLAVWGGGNELMDDDGRPLDETAPALGALAAVVAELDPDRIFLPTSPTGRVAHNTLATIAADPDGLHDVHGPWEHQGLEGQHALYDAGTSLLSSEFGVEGMTNRAALEASVSAQHRWPPTRDNPVYAHRGAWWNNAPFVQAAFGGRLHDLDAVRRASQLLQADGLRTAVEATRRRQWRSSGTIPWQLNEPFPNAWCTSALDAYGRPKPAYHAVAAAYEPVHAGATFARQAWGGHDLVDARLWVVSAERERMRATLTARVVDAHGGVASHEVRELHIGPSQVTDAGSLHARIDAIGTDLFVLDLSLTDRDGHPRSANRYLLSRTADLAPLLELPRAGLVAERTPDGDRWEVRLRNTGPVLAAGVRLEDARPATAPGWATPDADHLDLLPGEERCLLVHFRDVAPPDRRLRLSGWNVEEQALG